MSEDGMLDALIHPLQFLEADEPPLPGQQQTVTLESVLTFICATDVDINAENLAARYRDISKNNVGVFAVPNEQRILDKLVWPLRHAKANYMVGNHIGTISLCGMVAEMLAILYSEICVLRVNKQPMTTEQQKDLFGCPFEKLSQERRIAVLKVYGIVNEAAKADFDLIRTTRRKYLHLWSQDHDTLPKDAINVFNAALRLTVRVIGQDVVNGKILLEPALVEYLKRTGTCRPTDNNE